MDFQIEPASFRGWLIGARSEEVDASRITSRGIMGQTLIFYRDGSGRAVVLDGRCPHKGVSLAEGRLRGGEVQCPYHGWRFDSAGLCTHVPSATPDEPLPCARLESFPVVEQDGWVWVYWGQASAEQRGAPPRYPREKSYRWFETVREIKSPPHFILENSFDAVHANFVHGGLLRTDPVQHVEAKISETPSGVAIQTLEREGPKSVFSKILPFLDKPLHNRAELVLPFTAFVSTRYGALHHLTLLTCVPIDEETTRVYTRSGVTFGRFTFLAYLFFRLVTPFIIPQDIRILENQARTFRQYRGSRYGFPRQADVPAFWAMRAYRDYLEGKLPNPAQLRSGEVVFKV